MNAALPFLFAAAIAASRPSELTRIRSETADYDRAQGIAVFEGHVVIEHAGEYSMGADRLYAVMSASNELGRVVAVGNVVVTNASRVGTCAIATYRRARREIEMLGDGKGGHARLVDFGEHPGELEGERIRFWLDAEQVEVENARITTGGKGGMELL